MRLRELGAKEIGARFECNIIFDGDPSILEQKKLLRLRINISPNRESRVLTWKEPARSQDENGFKRREEIEISVGDATNATIILGKLGFAPRAVYEKFRASYILDFQGVDGRALRARAELDELPFGKFIELEGDEDAIEIAARLLGLNALRTSVMTYHELHREWRSLNGLPPAIDIRFDPEDKEKLAKRLCISKEALPVPSTFAKWKD